LARKLIKMKKRISNNKGFTLIELTISSAILAVIFGGMTIFGVRVLESYNRSRVIKNTMENASYAIESINKTIRTSHTINDGGNKIFFIDNYLERSYCYSFEEGKLMRKTGDETMTECNDITDDSSEIVGSDKVEISGTFKIKKTDRESESKERGFVRTNLEIKYLADNLDKFDDDKIIIQSSVSLRDYGYNFD